MIKLVVCDVDGTLLPRGDKFLSGELISIIKEFNKKNIVFAVASGRQYCELRRILDNTDGIFYIPSDGGAVIYDNAVLDMKTIPSFSVKNIINKPNLVFHGVFDSYCKDLNIFNIIKDKYGESAVFLSGKTEEISDKIIKISKFSPMYSEVPQCTYEVYKTREWTEWIKVGAGKEKAVEFIQNKFKISIAETAVFGDGFNDMGMMRRGTMKFVIKNSQIQNRIPGSVVTDNIAKELFDIQNR